MNDASDGSDSEAEALRYAHRLQAEIAADADVRRRQDPELERVERDIERAWADLAPPGATGPSEELLLDRFDRLSMIDVDAPVGSRPGVRQAKTAIRKGTYWYLRYVSDQLNALHNVSARLLRRMDERLARLEDGASTHRSVERFVDPVPDTPASVAALVANHLHEANGSAGQILVCSCGRGEVVAAVAAKGVPVYGVDDDPATVLVGVNQGHDLRVAVPLEHLAGLDDDSLAGIVLAGPIERRGAADLSRVLDDALRVVTSSGSIVVLTADPADRRDADAELLAGLGWSPSGWARVLERSGCRVQRHTVDDATIVEILVARKP